MAACLSHRQNDVRKRKKRPLSPLEKQQVKIAIEAQNGDQEAFATLYKQLFERLKGNIGGRIGDRAEAEDLAQKTFLLAQNKIKYYKPEYAFYTFLLLQSNTVVSSYWKQRARIALITEMPKENDGEENPDDVLDILIPSPSTQEIVIARLELLHSSTICGAKPHQNIAYIFVKLLEYPPRDVVKDLSDLSLGELAKRGIAEYFYDMEPLRERGAGYWRPLDEQLNKVVKEVYDVTLLGRLSEFHDRKVKEVIWRIFYTPQDDPADNVSDWAYDVRIKIMALWNRKDSVIKRR